MMLPPESMIVIATFAILVAIEYARRDITRRLDRLDRPIHTEDVNRRFAELRAEAVVVRNDVVRACEVDAKQAAEIEKVRDALEEMKERSAYR